MRERANPGLHDHVFDHVLRHRLADGARVADLGAGDGAMSVRLAELGADVTAVELEALPIERAGLRSVAADLNRPFACLGPGAFDVVVAIEVIEHLQDPIGFLREVRELLAPGGVAVLTTPNVDGFSSRLRYLRRGQLRWMGEGSDPTHVSPVTWWMFRERWLPAAGLRMVDRMPFPADGRVTSSGWKQRLYRAGAALTRTDVEHGTNHVVVLAPTEPGQRLTVISNTSRTAAPTTPAS